MCKIKPNERGITNIVGIKYEIYNNGCVQFVDWNGNGIFFSYENFSKDTLPSNKKDKINLKNIKIYPEIPLLDIKILDASSKVINESLDLFENQYYDFSFLLENTGYYAINEIIVNVYAYKKDDYKVSIDEIKVKPSCDNNNIIIEKNKSLSYTYSYLHKKQYKKIEFKFYYTSYQLSQTKKFEEVSLKPYLYYLKPLRTLKLINFSSLKVIPVLANNTIHEIALSDPSNIFY